ncbi:MAG: nucleoside hydrolase [Myxococcota bacterium]
MNKDPALGPAPRRVVLDTDTANEIDDQFALAWALLAPEAIALEAVHAAPFSHGVYFSALAAACAERGGPASRWEHFAHSMDAEARTKLLADTPPERGMERSFEEILRVFEAAGVAPGERVKRGSAGFLPGPRTPVESEAAWDLIRLARTASPEAPIEVAIIGAPTNVASALLLEPSIAPCLHVRFLAGHASGAGLPDDSFNLVQDRYASNVLLESDVPLFYLPGYGVAETLQLSLPDVEAWVRGRGALGDLLYEIYTHNPIAPNFAEPGRSWIIWDMIATASLINPDWLSSRTVPRAHVDGGHVWRSGPEASRTMTEAYRVDRNAVMIDFAARLEANEKT